MGDLIEQCIHFATRLAQRAGPYLLLEILVPGGTLLAFLLFASRQGRHLTFDPAASPLRFLVEGAIAAVRSVLDRIPVRGARPSFERPPERDGLEPLAM
jgi:hypothetical protein